ncbi:TonB-dependent receptor [Erythrobacteraceae bacterium E2-1 Yellow Sea]|nr:TonB-dependent receptor [Erythrobacteraceae bacterium E2-1 Yellow Sea]
MRNLYRQRLLATCYLAAFSMAITSGSAALAENSLESDESTGDTGVILVTAQRRAESAQNVGISITALGGAEIQKLGSADARDIAKLVPGVILDATSGGSWNANLVIRGISQSDFSSNQESPNSIYIDDVFLSSPNAAAFTFYDLERVEVLRGPQGTLFGRASSGGLMNFIFAKPTDVLDGYAEAGYGSYNQFWAEGAVGGPITDGVRARLAGRFEKANGYYKNEALGGKDTFEKDLFGIRAQVEADLSEDLTARVSISYDKSPRHREGTYTPETWQLDALGQPIPVPANIDVYGTGPGADFAGYRRPDKDVWTNQFNSLGRLQSSRFSPTLNLEWTVGDATVTSITNYTKFKYDYIEDTDGGPFDYTNGVSAQNLDQFSQELRINGEVGDVIYTGGIYFLDVQQSAPLRYVAPALAGTDFAFSDINLVRQTSQSIAAFGQIEYQVADDLKLTVGGRWTRDRKTMNEQVLVYELGEGYFGGTGSTVYDPPLEIFNFSPETVGDLAVAKANMFSGKIAIDYKPSSDVLLYASVSRGVKGPGFNTNLSGNLPIEETPFRSEYLYAYELGSKLQLLDRKLQLNLSAFNYDYHRFQGYAYSGLQGIVGNYDGYFRGGELELAVRPGSGVNANLGVAYLRTKLRDVPTQYNGVRDQDSINAPKWTVNGSISKTFEIGMNDLTIQWSGNYVDDRYASLDNNAATYLKGSFIHNARISYNIDAADLEIAVFVNNISDTARQTFAYDLISSQGNRIVSYDRPRWFGGSIRKSF